MRPQAPLQTQDAPRAEMTPQKFRDEADRFAVECHRRGPVLIRSGDLLGIRRIFNDFRRPKINPQISCNTQLLAIQ